VATQIIRNEKIIKLDESSETYEEDDLTRGHMTHEPSRVSA
jgi:hypothetical protein